MFVVKSQHPKFGISDLRVFTCLPVIIGRAEVPPSTSVRQRTAAIISATVQYPVLLLQIGSLHRGSLRSNYSSSASLGHVGVSLSISASPPPPSVSHHHTLQHCHHHHHLPFHPPLPYAAAAADPANWRRKGVSPTCVCVAPICSGSSLHSVLARSSETKNRAQPGFLEMGFLVSLPENAFEHSLIYQGEKKCMHTVCISSTYG